MKVMAEVPCTRLMLAVWESYVFVPGGAKVRNGAQGPDNDVAVA